MLCSVLSSPRAIAVNIEIMRTFVTIRHLTAGQGALALQLRSVALKLELLSDEHDRLPIAVIRCRTSRSATAPVERRCRLYSIALSASVMVLGSTPWTRT